MTSIAVRLWLMMVAVLGDAASVRTETAPALRVFVSGSRLETLDIISDGHFHAATDRSVGVEGDVMWPWGTYVHGGFGVRYELAHAPAGPFSPSVNDHFFYVPLFLGGRVPLARRHELEAVLGFGLMFGMVDDGTSINGSYPLFVTGPNADLSVSYWIPVTHALDLSVGAALEFALFSTENGGSQFSYGSRIVLPFRAGVRWGIGSEHR